MESIRTLYLKSYSLIRKFFCAWFGAACFEYVILPWNMKRLQGILYSKALSFPRMCMVFVTIFLVEILTEIFVSKYHNNRLARYERIERIALFLFYVVQAICSLIVSFTIPFLLIHLLVCIILMIYIFKGWNQKPIKTENDSTGTDRSIFRTDDKNRKRYNLIEHIKARPFLYITVALAIIFFLFLSTWGVLRLYTFMAPTYDFSLFAQMFHYMKQTGLPYTTLERSELLSHFQVHLSPVFYLILPIYWLIPREEILQIVQAFVMVLAIVPLWKLAKEKKLSDLQAGLVCIILMTIPIFSGGASFDIHENCFLTYFLLLLFLMLHRENTAGMIIAAILTLSVKEDAAIYVALIGLYAALRGWLYHKRKIFFLGIGLLTCSILTFLGATYYLREYGDGVMAGRFSNFYSGVDASLFEVIKNIWMCPMKLFFEIVDQEKLYYIGLSIVPFLPGLMLTRKYENYLLLIPCVLLNLMSDYPYQHSIQFQYSFGSVAFLILFYLEIITEYKQNGWKTILLGLPAAIFTVMFATVILPKASLYVEKYHKNNETYKEIEACLDIIPEDASVTTSSFYTAALYDRDILYDLFYAKPSQVFGCEYIVIPDHNSNCFKQYTQIPVNDKNYDGFDRFRQELEFHNYEMISVIPGKIMVYKKNE